MVRDEAPAPGERRCMSCGGEMRGDATGVVSVPLERCGVTVAVAVPGRACASCGEVQVEDRVAARAQLAAGCALADAGVRNGEAFRHMRKALGLRAADLARLLDVTPETISHWETDRAAPARAAFVALAAMVEESLDGRTTSRDRLAVLAEGRAWPGSLQLDLRARPSR